MTVFFCVVLAVSSTVALVAAWKALKLYVHIEEICPGFNHFMRHRDKEHRKEKTSG